MRAEAVRGPPRQPHSALECAGSKGVSRGPHSALECGLEGGSLASNIPFWNVLPASSSLRGASPLRVCGSRLSLLQHFAGDEIDTELPGLETSGNHLSITHQRGAASELRSGSR